MAVFEGISKYLQPDGSYIYHLAHYMFVEGCRSHKVHLFIMFIGNIHIKNPTLHQSFISDFNKAQHVSGDTPPNSTSLKLH
jgi:hypothetical protein